MLVKAARLQANPAARCRLEPTNRSIAAATRRHCIKQGIAINGRSADLGVMSQFARAPLTAILGPTNTGKTYLAVERMAAHSSGMIGFPLRLLAREVYDRMVAIKGAHQVALITGEEKILPRDARWFLCTAESMPMDRNFAF